jgi:hypothetical protein
VLGKVVPFSGPCGSGSYVYRATLLRCPNFPLQGIMIFVTNTVATLLFACSFVILLMTLLVKENSALRKYLWKKIHQKGICAKKKFVP